MSDTGPSPLRSAEWFAGTDEVALLHRAAMRMGRRPVTATDHRPVIAVTTSETPLNPCNTVLGPRIAEIVAGIEESGGVAVTLPTMSLGEDLMKPTAMLYRNLLAMEVEEYLRTYPLDGVVVTGNCDKTIPGALMGALSADLPTLVVPGGARSAACFRGGLIGTSDVWRLWQEHQAGRLAAGEWAEVEDALGRSAGACNAMGTASTMAVLTEALGLMLPGTATAPAGSADGLTAARRAGHRIVELVGSDVRPSTVLTAGSFHNAGVVLAAVAGSTNAVIHLVALARRAGIPLTLEDLHSAGRGTSLLTDIAPAGAGLVEQFHRDGGVPALLGRLRDRLDLSAATVDGRRLGELVETAPSPGPSVHAESDPVVDGPSIEVVYGSLAPGGAVIKRAAASVRLMTHRGPAVVFDDYDDMRARIVDPDLDVTPDSVLIMRGCGPVGTPGMPEWGMIPIPPKLLAAGVTDMVRITDARMSGTSFGTVFLHACPEAAVGGPLALVRTGDEVRIDADGRRIDLVVDEAELAARRAAWRPARSPHVRGWPALYQQHVNQANDGCDLDFLTLAPGETPTLVPPVVGRS